MPDSQAIAKREIETTSALLGGFEGSLITVVTATNVAQATGQFKQLKAWEKELDSKEKGITGPLNEALKGVRDLFRPTKTRLVSLISNVRGAIDTYNREVQEALAAKQERLEEKVESGTLSERSAGIKMARAEAKSNVDVIPTRRVKVLRINDITLIPEDYWDLNQSRIKADLLGGIPVPGAELVEDQIVVNR